MEARDPNGLWCIEMAKVPYTMTVDDEADDDSRIREIREVLDSDFYLTADFDQNLTLLQRQEKGVDDYERMDYGAGNDTKKIN